MRRRARGAVEHTSAYRLKPGNSPGIEKALSTLEEFERLGVLGVEMECAGLYGLAAEFGARALGLLTVSDHIRRHEKLSPAERQSSFDEMIEIALDVAHRAV